MKESGRCLTPVSTPDHIRELSPVEEGDRSGTGETPPQSAGVLTPVPTSSPSGGGGGARPKNPLTQSLSPNFKQRASSSRSHVKPSFLPSQSSRTDEVMINQNASFLISLITGYEEQQQLVNVWAVFSDPAGSWAPPHDAALDGPIAWRWLEHSFVEGHFSLSRTVANHRSW